MNFISNGDFNFPFDVHYYWAKLVYIWSYQTGSANPDGVIRMPGRSIDLLVFALMGNITISIFYLITCLIIVFLAFYSYSKYFLKISSVWLSVVASLFFTINPIFLGNVSKIGLVLAAAMLPFCLVVIQKAFEKQQLRYLLLWVGLLNISLIHPFTMTVNLVVSGIYLTYMSLHNKPFIKDNFAKILLVGLVGILLNAYFLLPIASLGSVNKDVLSSSVASTPTDYTALIDVANTGDIFTGLSLAKGVLKDYEFYNKNTQSMYFFGIFTFYVILFGVYVRVEKKLSISDRRYFAWALGSFLILLLLAAVNYLFVKDLIKLIVGLPGGWIFRSPLKWQLYIPFTMATMLVVALAYAPRRSHRIALSAGLGISFICMNGFISAEVYSKLLTPRQISYFGALQQTDLNQKNLLIINDEKCFSFASQNSTVMTELNQILTSKNVQVKQMSSDVADTVNLSSYDYVLGCQNTAAPTLENYDFNTKETFVDNAFQMYANTKPKPYIYTNQKVFALEKPQQVSSKYQLVTDTLDSEFDFIDMPAGSSTTTYGLQDAYEDISFADMKGSSFSAHVAIPKNSGIQTLYLNNTDTLSYQLSDDTLSLTPQQPAGFQALDTDGKATIVDMPRTDKLKVDYNDSRYDSLNIFPNPSLEQGPWQKQVGDCYAYGTDGKISMKIDKTQKSKGGQSLQLSAESHVACTGPNDISVEPEQNYLLSFDYKSPQGRYGAYYVSFDDPDHTSRFSRLDTTTDNWKTIIKNIAVPAGAHNMKLLVYAYPDTSGIDHATTLYDNFHLTATPKLQHQFYVLGTPKKVLQQPKDVRFDVANPTKTTIHITGASTPFYLETKESYSPRWNLKADGGASVEPEDHFKINNFMNGWLIDPAQLCKSGCQKNDDGSYDISLVMEFAPQRWLYIGATVSVITLVATISYLVHDKRRTLRAPDRTIARKKRL